MSEESTTVVPDTSVVIDGRVTTYLEANPDTVEQVIIPEAVVNELEAQANSDQDSGWSGLEELQRLASLDDEGTIRVSYDGASPSPSSISGAGEGDIDALVREVASERGATLLTSDEVQAETARARGIAVEYVDPEIVDDSFEVEEFFDEGTMSVHLKSETIPKAKSGALGEIDYSPISDEPTSVEQMETWASEIEAVTEASTDGFFELSEPGMDIVQLRDYRIAIARPPFSDGIEITAVKPVAKTTLDDYRLYEDVTERLTEQKRGVLISGSPGAGKSTFAQAVGEYLNEQGVVVKTMEKPRDLQVGPEIAQYTALDGEMEKTADSLLLVRPDYTIYDEVRKTDDFDVFADMRLAGVGMIGVVHATRAIDALQRLVGRVELGLIPQIVDTVIYIEEGDIHTVYDITTEVKVPHGMNSEDLARPVIQVRDFETGRAMYEVYTFNRQVVTVELDVGEGIDAGHPSASNKNLLEDVQHAIRSVASGHVDVDVTGQKSATVYVESDDISRVIGKGGSQIDAIESQLGMDIDVREHDERASTTDRPSNMSGKPETICHPTIEDEYIIIDGSGFEESAVEIRANGEYLFTISVASDGIIKLSKDSEIGKDLKSAMDAGKSLAIVPT